MWFPASWSPSVVEVIQLHPILVANARVDWLALTDDEITQQFPILREHGSLTSFGVVLDIWYQQYTTWRSSTYECFGCFTLSPAFRASHLTLWHLPWSLVWCFGLRFCLFSPCLVCFASARDVLTSFFNYTALDDRQCFHARSASR